MKNFIKLSFSVLLVLFFGCNISIEDEILLDKPTCKMTGNEISISLPKESSDTSYINIYREDITKDDGEISNIGIIFATDNSIYFFSDPLIIKNHEYKYYARYREGNEYFKTEWSDSIKATNGYNESDLLKYDVSSAQLTLNKTDYTLKIEGTINSPVITNFSTEYTPMIIIKNADKTQVFSLKSVADGSIISLFGTLPSEYIDTPIKIVGICAQKINYSDEEKKNIESVLWSDSSNIKLTGCTDNTFTISSSKETDGFDYTRSISVISK